MIHSSTVITIVGMAFVTYLTRILGYVALRHWLLTAHQGRIRGSPRVRSDL